MSTSTLPGRVPVWWVRQVRRPADAQGLGPAAGSGAASGAGHAGTVVVHGVATDERPDGTVVDVGGLPAGAAVAAGRIGRVTMRAGSLQLLTVEALGEHAADAPRLVLVERVRRGADPVTTELVAFAHEHVTARAAALGAYVAAGTVVTQADAARLGLRSADQVGALRWCPSTGQVLEVYVAPAHRRRRVAMFLLLAAEGTCAARGWPHLWGDGVRTALGEAMLRRLRYGVGRIGALTRLAPPMTPPSDAVGVPRRLLEPVD
ncbi:hypothetical protein ACFUMH_09885 [Cellulomonas sp. NPDC057328]|uniref:hypothetical protein n=1 Tax=Cellulomonas sp. NPDC057328 TaxID=3346101 RepID=UPI003639F09D